MSELLCGSGMICQRILSLVGYISLDNVIIPSCGHQMLSKVSKLLQCLLSIIPNVELLNGILIRTEF